MLYVDGKQWMVGEVSYKYSHKSQSTLIYLYFPSRHQPQIQNNQSIIQSEAF